MSTRRTTDEVFAQLESWALGWDNVRALILNGSRADPERTPDALSDYDVAVFVRTTSPIVADDSWLAGFGPIMVRWPLRPMPTFSDTWITQLVQFSDGVRIDFQITAEQQIDPSDLDWGFQVLVDKDGRTDDLPASGGSRYRVQLPTAEAFADRLNAFWWDIIYVAKGLARGELGYAKYMLDVALRWDKLEPLLSWHVGVQHGWQIDIGIHGRWFERYLEAAVWELYLQTFADSDAGNNWHALFAMVELVQTVGRQVAVALEFAYPERVDAEVTRYLRAIQVQLSGTGPTSEANGES